MSCPNITDYRCQTHLRVNTSDQHYVASLERSQGEQQLRALADTSRVEETWLFVEGKDRQGKNLNLWYEIGTTEQK